MPSEIQKLYLLPPRKNSQVPQDSEGEEEEDLSPTHQVVEDVKAVESRGATPKQQVLFW